MSNRWLARSMLGLPLDERDLDDLIDAAPELLQDDHPMPYPFPFLVCHPFMELPYLAHKDLQDQWSTALQAARKRARYGHEQVEAVPQVATSVQECPHPECPLRKDSQPRALEPESQPPKGVESEEVVLYKMVVMAPGQSPKKQFLNMATHLRGRIKNGVTRVIVTDPYVHDMTDDALLDFLKALGLTKSDTFTLELTPGAKGVNSGQPLKNTPLGSTLITHFPNVILTNHKACKGGFHDRFYLTVDGKGNWDGLFGPSLNGLASQAIVIIGELDNDSPAKRNLKKLLD